MGERERDSPKRGFFSNSSAHVHMTIIVNTSSNDQLKSPTVAMPITINIEVFLSHFKVNQF